MISCTRIKFCCSAFVIACALSAPVSAHDKEDFDGPALFKASCASCHGLAGNGDGPVAEALKAKIKPLATLAKRNDGAFPEDYVYRVVDGREEVKAHGDRQMPVWGTYYRLRHQGAGTESSTDTIIQFLVAHIKSMQVE